MRIILFICLIFLLLAGWIAGWFYVAGQVETAITQVKQKLTENGQSVECDSQEINGFPFRISLNCSQLRYENALDGTALLTGPIKSAAQAYQPNKLVAEVTSPANVTLRNRSGFSAQWGSMRTSLAASLSGPNNFSLQGRDLTITPDDTRLPPLYIAELQMHSRRNGSNAIDIAVSIDDATTQQKLWPDYDFNLDVRLDDIYNDLIRRTNLLKIAREKGLSGELYNLKYSTLDGGTASLSGPVQVDRNGILTAKLLVTVSELPKILEALGRSLPHKKTDIDRVSVALSALAGSNQNGEFKLPITVKNGKIIIGLFPVGEVPPLF